MSRAATAGLVLLFLAGLLVNAVDLARPADRSAARPGDPTPQVFRDYRDTAYWPVRDLVAGNNPYDVHGYLDRRPGLQEFGLYLPAWLLLALPLAVLPYDLAKVAYLGVLLLLALGFGWALVRVSGRRAPMPVLLGVVGAVLLCAPGQATLYLGQATFQVMLGVVVAVHLAARRPGLAGLGVA
ncbi:MAG TPA: glycosyltransferase 87 family protein, partial [Acidimicrobiales bacterium]